MPLQNKYGGSGGVYFNPNETEEEKRKRYQAEFLRDTVSDEQIKSQQSEYDKLTAKTKGPQGRTVGSRNTFVAATGFEHLADVLAKGIRGKAAKKIKGSLEESLAKKAAARATEKADERIKGETALALEAEKTEYSRIRDEQLDIIKKKQAEVLEGHYNNLDETAKNRLANDEMKAEETKANNIRKHVAKMAELDAEETNFTKTTAGERDKTGTLRSKIRVIEESGKSFKDSYARPFGNVPFISRAAVRLGTTTGYDPTNIIGGIEADETRGEGEASNFQDSARWLANWKMGFTLEERNRIFGATLTPNEQIAWDEAGDININMEASEIRRRVAQIEKSMRGRADDGAYTAISNGQNPAAWYGMTSPGFDPNTYATGGGSPAAAEGGAPAAQQVISYKDVDKY